VCKLGILHVVGGRAAAAARRVHGDPLLRLDLLVLRLQEVKVSVREDDKEREGL